MKKSVFDPGEQQQDISSKIVAGLERISEVFKVLLWEKAKTTGLSPIQIQLLIFIAYHKRELCNVSHLAKEFNVTKPTVSDAIRILGKKKLIVKDFSSNDSRSYTVLLSGLGEKTLSEINNFADPLKSEINTFDPGQLEIIFENMSQLIFNLNRSGVLTVQRTCFGCKYYRKRPTSDFCTLLQKELLNRDIRIDCPDFEKKELPSVSK